MVSTVNLSEFRDAFVRMDRKENFTHEGLEILFDFFEEADPNMELDVIAICCEYNEDTVEDIASNYSIDLSDCDTDEDKKNAVREYLNENTCLVGETDETLIYSAF